MGSYLVTVDVGGGFPFQGEFETGRAGGKSKERNTLRGEGL